MAVADLVHRTRPAAGEPRGALVLFHGRGVDEHDLFPLLDALDPERGLVGVTPRAPLTPPGHTGNHWYVVERVGFPEPASFAESCALADGWLEDLEAELGLSRGRVVLGGFSQGAVMAFALGLGEGRPSPAAILALSGFVPTVSGWRPEAREGLPVYLSHGANDPVIPVEFARAARAALEPLGVELSYHETAAGHWIEPATVAEAHAWLASLPALSRER